jgi:hypothetical protein
MAHKKDYFWTVNMEDKVKFGNNNLAISSKHMILDSGVSYALIPTEDFQALHQFLNKPYGISCSKGDKKDNFSA